MWTVIIIQKLCAHTTCFFRLFMDPFNRNMKALSIVLVVLVVVCATLAKKNKNPLCKGKKKGRRTDRVESLRRFVNVCSSRTSRRLHLIANTGHPVALSCSFVWQDTRVQRCPRWTRGGSQGTGEWNRGAEEWTKRYPRPGWWTQWPRSRRCQVYLLCWHGSFFFFSLSLSFSLSGIRYVLAEPATNCNAGCDSVGLQCVAGGFDGQDVKKVYESIGRTCESEDGYVWADQPCITEEGHCYGTTNLPEAGIDCAPGQNGSVRRLCPCA